MPSLGIALVGIVALMATLGLALGTRWPAISADAGTALSTTKAALSGNHQWIEMLAPPVQVALYAPFLSLGHPELASAVPALFGALVLLLVVATAWRITGMHWAGAIAGLFLLSSPEYWERSSRLPAYQAFVFLGYLGLLLTASALRSPRRSSVLAIGGGVALALSAYSFTIGLLFLPATLLLAFAWKSRWKPVVLSLSTAAVLLVPFAIWHVAVAGVRKAWFYPYNFLLVEHSKDFRSFLNRPDYDLAGYVTDAVPGMLLGAAPISLWLVGSAGLLAISRLRGARVSAMVTAAMVAILVAFVAVEQPPHARYAYVLVPGVALVGAIGLALALQSLAQRQIGRHLAMLAASGVALLAVVTASTAVSTHLDEVETARADSRYADLRAVAGKVDDDRALLARTAYLQVLVPDNQVYTHIFFSKDEYLGYVLWQDADQVRRLLASRDIGWVVFQKNVHRWERDFNFWALTATGHPPHHYICLPQSAGFSQIHDGPFFTLYKVDQDWLRADAVSESCAIPLGERYTLPGAWRSGSAGPR